EEPYDRYLTGVNVYTISGDTLISESFDSLGKCFYVCVQIGREVYFDSPPFSGDFLNVSSYKTSLEQVEDWERCRYCDNDMPAENLKGYLGAPFNSEKTSFLIGLDSSKEYPAQFALAGIFRDVFTNRGFIHTCIRTYEDQVKKRTLQKDGLKYNTGSCRKKLLELNW
ncbi:MAG: hypothetical protein AAF597_16365, partial [Bacteroidota bacterium]